MNPININPSCPVVAAPDCRQDTITLLFIQLKLVELAIRMFHYFFKKVNSD